MVIVVLLFLYLQSLSILKVVIVVLDSEGQEVVSVLLNILSIATGRIADLINS